MFDEEASPNNPVDLSAIGEAEHITWKTWVVIFILSSCFGLSFWPVPTTGAMQAGIAGLLGDESGTSSYWFVVCVLNL